MAQPIITAIRENLPDSARDDLKTAVVDMVTQLNEDSSVDTFFYDHNLFYEITISPKNYSDEETYVRDVIKELDENVTLIDGDSIIVADNVSPTTAGFGYGFGGVKWSPLGDDAVYTGARVLYTPSQTLVDDPVETFYNLAIHEVAHGLSSNGDADKDHEDGEYQLTLGPDNQLVPLDVSPLATAYTYVNEVGGILGPNVDTDWQGGSDVPKSFCDFDNFIGEEWCGGDLDPCRHTTEMSFCIKNKIDEGTPLRDK